MSPREIHELGKIRREEQLETSKSRRWETAIICSHILQTQFGNKKRYNTKDVYESMAVKAVGEDEEKPKYQTYTGSLADQLRQHRKSLEEQAPVGNRI